jgi:hypothetical protein
MSETKSQLLRDRPGVIPAAAILLGFSLLKLVAVYADRDGPYGQTQPGIFSVGLILIAAALLFGRPWWRRLAIALLIPTMLILAGAVGSVGLLAFAILFAQVLLLVGPPPSGVRIISGVGLVFIGFAFEVAMRRAAYPA